MCLNHTLIELEESTTRFCELTEHALDRCNTSGSRWPSIKLGARNYRAGVLRIAMSSPPSVKRPRTTTDVSFADPTDVESLLLSASPFGNETGSLPNGEFVPGLATCKRVSEAKVLVLGAGGLGCEVSEGRAR